MTRKRWIALLGVMAAACLLAAGIGVAYLGQTVPGAALLLGRATAPPTAIPIGERDFSHLLPTATTAPSATPEPTATLTPSPTAEPSATRRPLSTDPPAASATPEPTATLTPSPSPSPTAAPPSPTPRPQWIAFESKRGELRDYEIVVMRPDGSRAANLTQSWADDLAPAWGPGGRQIAFVSLRDTISGKWGLENSSIYGVDFDPATGAAGKVWRITDGEGADGWPTWSPDGRRVAFHSDRSGNWDIWIANADGTGLVQLTRNPENDRYPDWGPGGKLAFTSNRGGNEDIWVLDVDAALNKGDDTDAVNLTKTAKRDRYGIWSPDGRQLTFNTNRDGNFEVYVMNADGTKARNLSNSPKSTEGLADWAPDGRRLVFYSDRGGNKEVYIMDLASLAWTNISNHQASDEFCAWSP